MISITLEGKTALITGASQGIGWAVAKKLAEAGASCILVSRQEEMLKERVLSLSATSGQQHKFFAADMSDKTEVDKLIEFVNKEQPIHILVNNSGGPKPGLIQE